MLGCKKNKAIDTIKELDAETGIGLIEKKRQGQGKPAIIYVKSFVIDEPEVGKTNFLELEKGSSGSLKSKPLEVGKKDANKNNIINTDFSKTNLIVSDDAGKGLDEYTAYSEIIRENLELEILYQRYPYDVELIDGIYDLVLETVLCKSGTVIIASNEYPVQLVKSKFLKLNSSHIEYVIGCLKSNTSKVRNIKKYLLASLFNAPTTIQGYFQAEVNHDMPQFASVR